MTVGPAHGSLKLDAVALEEALDLRAPREPREARPAVFGDA